VYKRQVDSFLKAAEQYGGDPIAINLIKESYIMAKNKVIVVDSTEKKVVAITANVEKANEKVTEAGAAGASYKVVENEEAFGKLPKAVRLAIAKTNADVATMPEEEQLARAYEVACKPVKAPKAPPKARAKGVKQLIRELFSQAGARYTVAEMCEKTGGTEVSVKTAISDLRSPTYCKPGDPLNLSRVEDNKYALLSDKELAAMAAAKEKAIADAKAAKAKAAEEKKAAKAKADAEAKAKKEVAKKEAPAVKK